MTRIALVFLLLPAASRTLASEWKRLPTLPDQEGFAAPFAGVSHGRLMVAGGANFPDKKPWEGGKKAWYDTVFLLDRADGKWAIAGRLPRPLGYGVSATCRQSVICVGGSDASRHYPDVFRLEWKTGAIVITPLSPLPIPVANACGAVVGERLYIAGGQERPDSPVALKSLFELDLSAANRPWRRLEDCPGGGRVLAMAAAYEGAFWLVGGADLVAAPNGRPDRRYRKDAWCYRLNGGWTRVADLPDPIVAAPSPAPATEGGFFVLGGDDGSNAGFAFPERHPGFSKKIIRFDPKAGRWTTVGELPAARVTVPLVMWNKMWVMPGGESRPGVRSPEVWGVTFSNKE